MKVYRDFDCKNCGRKVEQRIENSIKEIECECGEMVPYSPSAPRSFGNTTGRSPSTGKI